MISFHHYVELKEATKIHRNQESWRKAVHARHGDDLEYSCENGKHILKKNGKIAGTFVYSDPSSVTNNRGTGFVEPKPL